MISKFHNDSEQIDAGEIIFDDSTFLSKVQIEKVSEIFQENRFWKSPKKRSEEEWFLDGDVIFIEGIEKNKYNVFSVHCPDEKHKIKKIYNEIISLAKSW